MFVCLLCLFLSQMKIYSSLFDIILSFKTKQGEWRNPSSFYFYGGEICFSSSCFYTGSKLGYVRFAAKGYEKGSRQSPPQGGAPQGQERGLDRAPQGKSSLQRLETVKIPPYTLFSKSKEQTLLPFGDHKKRIHIYNIPNSIRIHKQYAFL